MFRFIVPQVSPSSMAHLFILLSLLVECHSMSVKVSARLKRSNSEDEVSAIFVSLRCKIILIFQTVYSDITSFQRRFLGIGLVSQTRLIAIVGPNGPGFDPDDIYVYDVRQSLKEDHRQKDSKQKKKLYRT